MQHTTRDGKVAVLYSPGYGTGWYTANLKHRSLLTHPKVVEMVEAGRQAEIDREWIRKNLGIKHCNCKGAHQLTIEWLPVDTNFCVDEKNGSEYIILVKKPVRNPS